MFTSSRMGQKQRKNFPQTQTIKDYLQKTLIIKKAKKSQFLELAWEILDTRGTTMTKGQEIYEPAKGLNLRIHVYEWI